MRRPAISTKAEREQQARAEELAEDAAPLSASEAEKTQAAYLAKVEAILARYVARRAKAGNPVRVPFPVVDGAPPPDMSNAPAPETEEEREQRRQRESEGQGELAPAQVEGPYEESDMSFRRWRDAFLRGERLTIPTIERVGGANEYTDRNPMRVDIWRYYRRGY
jgi:hypothetical protein